MIKTTITEEQADQGFANGIDCAPAVFSEVAPQLGIERGTALKIAGCFGGGMWHGETCGCVTGALMAIGLKYGPTAAGDAESKAAMLAKKGEFEAKFCEKHGSCICKEILGYDLSKPEEMAKIMEKNLLMTVCPKLVVDACKILEETL